MGRGATGICVLVLLTALLSPANAQQGQTAPRLDPEQFERNFEALRIERERRERSDIRLPASPHLQKTGDTKPITKLTAVIVDGGKIFSREEISAIYRPYVGKTVSEADLVEIARQISELYRNAGFHLSRAIIPPQSINGGVVRVRIVEGAIVDVVVTGTAPQPRVRQLLDPVLAEHPARLSTLERQLLRINDTPGNKIRDTGLEELGEASGRFRLTVYIETWRVQSAIALDNRGIEAIGPLQSHFLTALNSAFVSGDAVGLHLSTIPDAPRELAFGQLWYDMPVGFDGSRFGVSASYGEIWPSDERRFLGTFTRSDSVDLRFTTVPIRTRQTSLWLTGSLGASDVSETDAGGPLYNDHLRTLTLAADYHRQEESGAWNYIAVAFRQGLPVLGASERNDPFLSRSDGDGSFSRLQFAYTRIQMLNEVWSVRFAAAGQIASTPLLASQEFNLGGLLFGRAYDTAELSGDNGIASSLELRFDHKLNHEMIAGIQLYGFVDGGAVRDFQPGEDYNAALASAGAGIRLFFPRDMYADISVAIPLLYRSTPNAHRTPRVFFIVSKAFKTCPDRFQLRCR